MKHSQSKLQSFIEACANTLAGLLFAYVIQLILIWAYDVPMSKSTAAHWVFWFTLASVLRSYCIRRLWNAEWWNVIRGIR